MSTAAPPQHRQSHVTLEHAEGLCLVGDVEAEARTGAKVEEPMSRDPLPKHAARWPLAILQHQIRALHGDAALQRLALQNEQTLFWKRRVRGQGGGR